MKTTCGDILPEAAHRPIADSVISRRVRPWLSRARVPVELRWIWLPSESAWVVCVENVALNGAPATVLPPGPDWKPSKPMASSIAGPGGPPGGSCARAEPLRLKNASIRSPRIVTAHLLINLIIIPRTPSCEIRILPDNISPPGKHRRE